MKEDAMHPTKGEVTDAEWLMHQLDHLPGCEVTKGRVRDLLRTMAGRRITLQKRALVQPVRVLRAVELLNAGRTVPQVRDALMASRLVGSKRTANRVVAQALAKRALTFRLPLMVTVDCDHQSTMVIRSVSLTGADDD